MISLVMKRQGYVGNWAKKKRNERTWLKKVIPIKKQKSDGGKVPFGRTLKIHLKKRHSNDNESFHEGMLQLKTQQKTQNIYNIGKKKNGHQKEKQILR